MHKLYKHIAHHAHKHHEAEKRLKKLLSEYNPIKERIFPLFFWTFIIVLLSLLIFRNWGNIINFFTNLIEPQKQEETINTTGYKTGMLGNLKIDTQAIWAYRNPTEATHAAGSVTGAEVTTAFGAERGEKPTTLGETLGNSIWVTSYLGTGQQMTKLEQSKAKALQKSILATYYLGEKTIDINSTIETDSKILSQMKNTLSVNLFQYLNQAVSRSDSLDEYLNLLTILSKKADERINDLQYKINFLSANVKTKETQLSASEKTFFENLKIFEGPNAEQELAKFVGLQQGQAEIKAKLGAYQSLQNYYKFFKPKLDNLIKEIEANRAALIAGVKVVEIQNMALPLIIQQK